MPDFEKLRIGEESSFTLDKWDELIDELENLSLTIPTNLNGEVLNSVSIGTKPDNGAVLNYPWEYESIGVAQSDQDLRLQSPQSVHIHTDIDGDLEKNKTKIPLTIHKNGRVGIINEEEPQAKLQIINANQDANGDTLVLGKIDGYNSNLRLGYHQDYSWIQSHGAKPLLINPIGNNVGIGTTIASTKLHIYSKIEKNGIAPLKIQTNWGYMDIGARNAGYAHFYTDLPRYYFNKNLIVNGTIGGYKSGENIEAKLVTHELINSRNGKKKRHEISFGYELARAGIGGHYRIVIFIDGKRVVTIPKNAK